MFKREEANMYIRAVTIIIFLGFSLVSLNAAAEVFELNKLVPVTSIKLHSIKDKYRISLPVPARWKVNGAVLKFSYVNSSALLAYKSRLVVSMDDIPLFQSDLAPLNSYRNVEVKIPSSLLQPGYHDLTFEVVQHSEKECEDPFAPELWTVLKLGEATLDIDYSARPIPAKLSSIPYYIEDPKIVPEQRINFVLDSLNEELLHSSAIVAGGIGARLSYRPVYLTASTSIVPGVDNIYIGTVKGLEKLGVSHETEAYGPMVSISHLPVSQGEGNVSIEGSMSKVDTTHVLVAVTGETMDEVKQAAMAFSSISFPFPQTPYMIIEDVEFPNLEPYHRKDLLPPGLPVKFSDLGFETHVFVGMSKEPVPLEFFLPPDIYIKPNQNAVLSLHFGFSGAVREDSTMKIELNGQPVSSIHLDNKEGAFYENYKILVPTYLFKPGRNIISFESVLVPLIIKRCQGFQDMNLFLTLFDDSKLVFPEMGHWRKMPQIKYFFDSGFPFVRDANGDDIVFLLLEKDMASVSLAMNIAAYLGQVSGIAPTNMSFVFDPTSIGDKDIVLIGPVSKLPEPFIDKAPLKLKGTSALVKYPQFVDLSQGQQRSLWQKLEEKLENYSTIFPVRGVTKTAKVKEQKVALDNETGLLMEFESPFSIGRTVLLWTGQDTNIFNRTSELIWTGRLRSLAEGDLVLYSTKNEKRVHSLKVGATYYTGALSGTEKIDFFMRSYPWVFYVCLGISLLVLVIIFASYLRWRRKKRLANEI